MSYKRESFGRSLVLTKYAVIESVGSSRQSVTSLHHMTLPSPPVEPDYLTNPAIGKQSLKRSNSGIHSSNAEASRILILPIDCLISDKCLGRRELPLTITNANNGQDRNRCQTQLVT